MKRYVLLSAVLAALCAAAFNIPSRTVVQVPPDLRDAPADRSSGGALGDLAPSGELGGAAVLEPGAPAPAEDYQNKIVGGTTAGWNEFPFIVSLADNKFGHFCGGSLIAPRWVLTAAHCVEEGAPSYVRVGLNLQHMNLFTEKFGVKRVIVHPQRSQRNDYDFALIELDGESRFETIALNTRQLPVGTSVTTAGWGATSEGSSSLPWRLRKVTVPTVSAEACAAAYPGRITGDMLCAGFEEGQKDSCQGDSGGPLIVGSGQQARLVGVVSWGQGCARPKKYGVYGNVALNLDWIRDTAK